MKRLFLFFILGLCAASLRAEGLKALVVSAQTAMQDRLPQASSLPRSLLPPVWPRVKISAKLKNALAEYKAQTDTVYLSKKHLEQWSARVKLPAQEKSALLARCLVPLYVHELSHARDQRQSARFGFVWPVTIEDEYVASFWQLHIIEQYKKNSPSYVQDCREFMPPAEILHAPAAKRREQVLRVYSRALGAALPPPMTMEYIQAYAQKGSFSFAGQTYSVKRRNMSLKRLRKRGGNWLYLSSSALKSLDNSLFYRHYLAILSVRTQEIKDRLY